MALTLGLSYENDFWKRDVSAHWWDRIVLETFTEEVIVRLNLSS